MDLFVDLLSCGCYMDIQYKGLYNIISHVARLDETDIILFL
jgi:hypothetical protein